MLKTKKTVRELIERLDPEQYIAVGSGTAEKQKDKARGSGFYFIGKAKQYKRDITGINRFYWNESRSKEYVPLEDRTINDIWNRHIPGEPPMISVLAEGTEVSRCALLSEYDKTYKMPPTKINDMTGFHNLRLGITQAAVNDYMNTVRLGGKTEVIEQFLESEWGELITGVNGKAIEAVCTLRGEYAAWRDDKECGRCKRTKCIHNDGTHFTTMERGELTCLKEEAADDDRCDAVCEGNAGICEEEGGGKA